MCITIIWRDTMVDENVKYRIGSNIAAYRKRDGLTQATLAEKLNYSDKAVSKWERGESIPDVTVLKTIADLFGVSLDYLVESVHDHAPAPESSQRKALRSRNQTVATLLSILVVWF